MKNAWRKIRKKKLKKVCSVAGQRIANMLKYLQLNLIVEESDKTLRFVVKMRTMDILLTYGARFFSEKNEKGKRYKANIPLGEAG